MRNTGVIGICPSHRSPRDCDPKLVPLPVLKELASDFENERVVLPILPAAAMRVLSADPREDPNDWLPVVRDDLSLSAHLIRLVNTPMFRATSPIESVRHAVVRLGFENVRRAVLLIVNREKLFNVPGHTQELTLMFEQSVRRAVFAQALAKDRHVSEESAFLAALMCDVGRPVLLQRLIEIQKHLGIKLSPEELWSAIDFCHTYVGMLVARRWLLPEAVCEVTAQHHAIVLEGPHSDLIRVIQDACRLNEEGAPGAHSGRDLDDLRRVVPTPDQVAELVMATRV